MRCQASDSYRETLGVMRLPRCAAPTTVQGCTQLSADQGRNMMLTDLSQPNLESLAISPYSNQHRMV